VLTPIGPARPAYRPRRLCQAVRSPGRIEPWRCRCSPQRAARLDL